MNYAMVRMLILKDWYLQRWVILGSLVGGAIALAITISFGKAGFFIGMILLITILIASGDQLAFALVVNERKEKTLAFVMSLPISSIEYTASKVLANLLIFLVPWTAILAGSLALILATPAIPHGLVPYVTIMCIEILVTICFVSCVAIVSESQSWAIATVIVGNLGFNVVGYLVAHVASIAATMFGPVVVWDTASVAILVAELATMILLFAFTFFVQSRKTHFL